MAEATPPKRRLSLATIALVLAALLALGAIVFAAARDSEGIEAGDAAAPAAPADPQAAIAAMRQQLSENPDDHRAWYMLGLTHQQMGQVNEAMQAYRRAMQLRPENPDYLSSLGEMILVSGGQGSHDQAEPLFRRALQVQQDHPAPRYYLAVIKDMKGQHEEAIDELVALLKEAPPGAMWAVQVREAVQRIGTANKIDVAGRLPAPPAPSVATSPIPGPTGEQMEAAKNMPSAQQDQMVRQMIEGLAARLRQNPRNEQGWTMLMRSHMVQGERGAADQALRSGLSAFAGDAAAQQRLRAAATELGIPQG